MDSAFSMPDMTIDAHGKLVAKLPKAIDLSHHLSLLARSRNSTPLKQLYQYMSVPGMIGLAGGLPSAEYFPFETLSAEVQSPSAFPTTPPTLAEHKKSKDPSFLSWLFGGSKKSNPTIEIPKYPEQPGFDPLAINLQTLLQYSGAQGHAALQAFIKEFVAKVYQPGYADWDILVNVGATDGWSKLVQTLCERGDPILVEEWTYPGATGAYLPLGCPQIPIKMDAQGLVPEDMDKVLSEWDEAVRGCRKPRLLYTVPTGQNPTGATMLAERKKAIYEVAVKHDIIICEDEPYYFLYADPWVSQKNKKSSSALEKTLQDELKGKEEFLKALPPSFLRYDYQGRVVRLDTFSKTICPGSRLGWYTCSPLFAERLLRASECTTNAPSGFSQALVTKLLVGWKYDGYIRWLRGIKATYAMRRDWMCDLFEDVFHLEFDQPSAGFPAGARTATAYAKMLPGTAGSIMNEKRGHKGKALLTFVPPTAGMFIWLGVDVGNTAQYRQLVAKGVENPQNVLMEKLWRELAENLVLVSPGYFFDGQAGTPHEGTENIGFFRLSFSSATHEQMEKAVKTMYKVMVAFFKED